MDNQKGFIMPITLIIVFFIVSYVTFQISQYIVEKEFFYEQNKVYTAETLIQMAIVDVKDILQHENGNYLKGMLYYEEGEVAYVVQVERDNILSISLISNSIYGSMKIFNYFYNKDEETFLLWLEER